MKLRKLVMLPALLVTLIACGGEPYDADADDSKATPQDRSAPTSAGPATGRVIEVRMITDDKGNYFAPASIEARQGDVLRFTIVSGVHNVNFTAEQNPGVTGLPPASELLQLPGQTYDLPITLAPGHYAFQCDPHAALGMVGTLEVEDD